MSAKPGPSRFSLRLLSATSAGELEGILRGMGVDPRGIEIMSPKGRFHLLLVRGLSKAAAVILKQEMLAKGGEAAIPREAYAGEAKDTAALLMATRAQFASVCRTLAEEPFGLKTLGQEIRTILANADGAPAPITIGGREFIWGERTYIMGIINATPDSFSGDGLQAEAAPAEAAAVKARAMVAAGADILDIGAESTRPGAAEVGPEEEIARLLPILRAVAGSVDVPISVDTSKAAVAEAALANGAHCLNDVWGLQLDAAYAGVAAKAGVPVFAMHNQQGTDYEDLMAEISRFLRQSLALAEAAGLPAAQVVLDPGIGFGKTREQNLAVLRRLAELCALGRPILVGTSRKSVVGLTLGLPVEERAFGTAATVALAVANGADMVRVHDVREMAQVARMADAVVRGGLP